MRARGSNERLEFLGDRVLGLLIAEWLVERYPGEPEGKLGPRLAHLVSRDALLQVAGEIGFAEWLTLGMAETGTANVVADALEAALGAMFLDGGLPAARQFVRRAWAPAMQHQTAPPKDPKTALQEYALARGETLPEYTLVSAEGPSHAPEFIVNARFGAASGRGRAGTKRRAEREAAIELLTKLKT